MVTTVESRSAHQYSSHVRYTVTSHRFSRTATEGATALNESTFPTYLIVDVIFGLLNVWAVFCVLAGLVGLLNCYRQWLKKSHAQRWEIHYEQSPVQYKEPEPMGKTDSETLKQEGDDYEELKAALFRQIDAILKEMEGAEE
jgi:hypothetical protein